MLNKIKWKTESQQTYKYFYCRNVEKYKVIKKLSKTKQKTKADCNKEWE